MTKPKTITLTPGSDEWRKMRDRATKSIPGKYSSLYFLNAKILGHEDLVPMTYRAHWAMCLFAEGMTGIPEIDNARIRLTLVPRGLGKSTLLTKGQTVHDLLRHPEYAVGIANEVSTNAEAFLSMIKEEFTSNELLRQLFPERIPDNFKDTTWRTDRIVIKRDKPNPVSPSVLAAGTNTTVTGVHMNRWRLDDLISQNAAEAAYRGNFSEMEGVERWISRLQPLLKAPKRDPIDIIGTRWWEGDIYEWVQKFWGHGEDPKEFVWVVKLPDGTSQQIKLTRIGEVAIFCRPAIENGASIFPERYTLEELEILSMEDPVFFAGQYLLEPAAGGASKFSSDWLRNYELEGDYIRFRDQLGEWKWERISDLQTFISVDPAFSKKTSSARTAIPVVGTNGKEFFLLEDFADHGVGEDDIANIVCNFFTKYAPRKIFVETIVAQIVIANVIRRVARERGIDIAPFIEEIKSHGAQKKNWRIYALEPTFKRGLFYTHRSHQNFIQEYTAFPRSALRDVLDALSFQVDAWDAATRLHGPGPLNIEERRRADQDAREKVRTAMAARRYDA
jgi:phage terminase large subunit-like protein